MAMNNDPNYDFGHGSDAYGSDAHGSDALPRREPIRDDELVVELPSRPRLVMQERLPSPYSPMEEVYLRGRAYRGLSGGTAPGWVLVMGWVMFGGPALFCLAVMLVTGDVAAFLPVLSVFLVILWRGTRRKMLRRRRRV